MKFQFNKRAALIATTIGTLLVSNIASYKTAYSGGYRTSITESRIGYMRIPEKSGAIIVSEVKGKPHYYFEPYPEQPTFTTKKGWNSEENRKALEHSITTGAENTTTGVDISYVSAACTPQTSMNIWTCTMRRLGATQNEHWTIEVEPKTGRWQARG